MKCSKKNQSDGILFAGLGLWCLTSLLTIYYPEKIIDLPQVTDKLHHIMLYRIFCTSLQKRDTHPSDVTKYEILLLNLSRRTKSNEILDWFSSNNFLLKTNGIVNSVNFISVIDNEALPSTRIDIKLCNNVNLRVTLSMNCTLEMEFLLIYMLLSFDEVSMQLTSRSIYYSIK